MNRLLIVLAIALAMANVLVMMGIARNVTGTGSSTTITKMERMDPTGWKPKPLWI
jgi:hypothetical protein